MFARQYWHGLIVDDEQDVHEVTKLTLKKEEFFGVKLKLHHATSAKEAMEMLRKDPVLARAIAFALVDVVMETDHAGLDFCRFVREDLRRPSMQLILRTGQPGMAAPRTVIDELSITNYLTKLEAAGDRLYMAVKASIQQFYDSTTVENWALALEQMRASCTNRDQLLTTFRRFLAQDMGQLQSLHAAYDFFGEAYAGAGDFKDEAAYNAVKGDIMARAAAELDSTTSTSFYSSDGSGIQVPNRVARVDNYVVVQTSAIGTNKLATLVLKDPSYPRDKLWYYGPIWRNHLSWLAQAMATR